MTAILNLNAIEPVEMKKEIQSVMRGWKSDTWDYQSLSVWYGNKIPGYLWTAQNWKEPLRNSGWKWPKFLKMCSYHTNDFVRWITEGMSWNELIKVLLNDLSDENLRRMYFFS